MNRLNRQHSAVTLLELLIVMSILVVMAGLGLPTVMRMVERSRLTSAAKELQAELNRTRLESMKSGEPLVFHFELGTGHYEILSKQEYDLRFPPQQFSQFPMPGMGMGMDMTGGGMSPDMMMSDAGQPAQVAGSIAPSLTDRGAASLSDLVASSPQRSLSDYGGNAPSLADFGPPSSLTDYFATDLQQIAAIPVSKFMSVYKTLPHQLSFRECGVWSLEFGVGGQAGVGSQEIGIENFSASSLHTPHSTLYSEPIFFFPNGRTSNAIFSVCSTTGKGYYMDVSLRGLTGTARLGDLEVMP